MVENWNITNYLEKLIAIEWNLSYILLFLAIFSLYLYSKTFFTFWKKHGFQFLKPNLIFGNISPIVFRKMCYAELMAQKQRELKNMGLKFGGIFAIKKPILLLTDPNLVKRMFIKDAVYFPDRGMYIDEENDPLSAHLLALTGPKWKKIRSAVSPIFTSAQLKNGVPMFLECAQSLVEAVGDFGNTGKALDVKEIMARYTTDVIGRVGLGVDCNCLKNPNAEFRKVGQEFFKTDFKTSFIKVLAVLSPNILRALGLKVVGEFSNKFFLKAYKEVLEFREQNDTNNKDIMSSLIKCKTEMNNTELAAQAFIFFLAGFETSSSTMSFFLFEMAKNPHIQNKLREEILLEIKNSEGVISYDLVADLPYLDGAVKETLRKYPTVSTMNRRCASNYTIPGTDKIIPKDTSVVCSNLALHMDPEFFPEPLNFDPNRFSDENKLKIESNTYLPFGIGPRNCVAWRFGITSVKMGLVFLLKNFRFSFYPGRKIPEKLTATSLLMTFEDDLWLKVEKI